MNDILLISGVCFCWHFQLICCGGVWSDGCVNGMLVVTDQWPELLLAFSTDTVICCGVVDQMVVLMACYYQWPVWVFSSPGVHSSHFLQCWSIVSVLLMASYWSVACGLPVITIVICCSANKLVVLMALYLSVACGLLLLTIVICCIAVDQLPADCWWHVTDQRPILNSRLLQCCSFTHCTVNNGMLPIGGLWFAICDRSVPETFAFGQ